MAGIWALWRPAPGGPVREAGSAAAGRSPPAGETGPSRRGRLATFSVLTRAAPAGIGWLHGPGAGDPARARMGRPGWRAAPLPARWVPSWRRAPPPNCGCTRYRGRSTSRATTSRRASSRWTRRSACGPLARLQAVERNGSGRHAQRFEFPGETGREAAPAPREVRPREARNRAAWSSRSRSARPARSARHAQRAAARRVPGNRCPRGSAPSRSRRRRAG